jgi:DNA polymerase delta subunit 1
MVMRENILGFQGNQKTPYLKITVKDPRQIRKLRETIEEGKANYKGLWKAPEDGILTFDDIQYTLRFMIDNGVWNLRSPEIKP